MVTQSNLISVSNQQGGPRRFAFVLIEEFSLLSFAAALDALRIANRMSGKPLYSWTVLGESADIVFCSAGTSFRVDDGLVELKRDDTVILCGGMNIQRRTSKKLLNWVRRETRKGLSVGGLCTAAYTMAKAGLLNGRRATIHWENQDSFTEDFDEVELTKSVFIKDGKFMTTAGGTSSIDLMLKLIAEDFGEDLANAVADQLIYSSIRTDQDTQRLSVPNANWRPPSKTKPSHSNDGNKHRRTDKPLAACKICWHVNPAVRAAFPALFKPQSKAVLHGTSPAKSPQPFDADGYERDQCGVGLWLCLTLSLFKMLPGALSNHTLP
jgi:putative intracellular protease/amidase